MKICVLILAIFTALSCSHFGGRQPSSDNGAKPRHIIITVHGLTGDRTTFGSFNEITKNYMGELNPNFEYEVDSFVYPTGRDEKNGTYEFAFGPNGLADFIAGKFKSGRPGPNDKISLVCHSQGGIIAFYWYFQSILKGDLSIVKHVDSLITLGTPFWGSRIASYLTDQRNLQIIPLIKALAPSNLKVTYHEVSDLAFASDTINTFRTVAVRMDSDKNLSDVLARLPVRIVNVMGILPSKKEKLLTKGNTLDTLKKFPRKVIEKVYSIFTRPAEVASGEAPIESDMAVSVPSSRWDFIYAPTKKITGDTTIESSEYRDFGPFLSKSEFHYVESAHLPIDVKKTFSMAYVGESCADPKTCDHPAYPLVLEKLANCQNIKTLCNDDAHRRIVFEMKRVNAKEMILVKQINKALRTFAIQINMKLNPGQMQSLPVEFYRQRPGNSYLNIGHSGWKVQDYSLFQPTVIDLSRNSNPKGYKIILGDGRERQSLDIVSREYGANSQEDILRVNISGRLEDWNEKTHEDEQVIVPIEIKLPTIAGQPALPAVRMNILVRPGYSTFTELDYTNAQ